MGYSFQIYGISEKEQEKPRNGDFILYEVVDEELIVLALLADGVSNSPCDWLASQAVCDVFFEKFVDESTLTLSARMQVAAEEANTALQYTEEQKGMLSAFSAIVWEIGTHAYYYLNIGDTRIYQASGTQVEQVSIDDAEIIFLRRNGKIATNRYGQPLTRKVITNALGAGDCKIKVNQRELYPGDLLILASDGFYSSYGVIEEVKCEFEVNKSLKNALSKVWCKNMDGFEDDASTIVLKTEVLCKC